MRWYNSDKCVSTTMTGFRRSSVNSGCKSAERGGVERGTIMEGESGGDQSCARCGSNGNNGSESWHFGSQENGDSSDNTCPNRNRSNHEKSLHKNIMTYKSRTNYSYLVVMTLALFQWIFVINTLHVVISPPVVSAIDLTPHGGFYQREGGRNEFNSGSSSAQQHSEYEDLNDMIMTCSRPTKSSRAAKYLAIKQLDIPCEMGDKKSAWCNLPGDKYPWHAVRRFVFENQGLMRRMYGEVRQLSLLRMEFEDDMDDEEEEERHGPPRGPPIPEDHRRNSILTEVLDESLPRILSDSPPEDQILIRDYNMARSTPRSLPTSSAVPIVDVSSIRTSSAASTTPMMLSTSSEEQSNATEVLTAVTVESVAADVNLTTSTSSLGESETASTPSALTSTNMARNAMTEEVVTEEAIQSTITGMGITETEKDDTSVDGETTVSTTEEMALSNLSDQSLDIGSEAISQLGGSAPEQQQLSDASVSSITGSMGSDEAHDFVNLDQNHILYFEDVGKLSKKPAASGSSPGSGPAEGGDAYVPPQPQKEGKLKAVNACPVKEEVVAPYWANNTRGEILALLNLYPFEQYIHWERCNHENKQMFCRQGCRCEQQYRLHRLLAFDPTNECRGIFSDWFRFPSCCVCRCYLNEYELMMLNAAGQEPNANPTSAAAKSRTSDRIRSPRKLLLQQLVDGPDVQGVDDIHFFYKQGFYHEHNHGAQPRRKRSIFPSTSP